MLGLLTRRYSISVVAFSMLLTTACTHTSVRAPSGDSCAKVDWWEAGRTEGVAGMPLTKAIQDSGARCVGSTHPLELELFQNGHEAGLVDYCTPSQGLVSGRSGLNYDSACPSYLEGDFKRQFEVGKKIHDLELEQADLSARIEKLGRLLARSSSGTALKAQIEELKTKRASLDVEVILLEQVSVSSSNF